MLAGHGGAEARPSVPKKTMSGAFVGETGSSDKPGGNLFPDFEFFPVLLRVGPWHPLVVPFISFFGGCMLCSGPAALESLQSSVDIAPLASELRPWFALLALYCTCLNIYAWRLHGLMPFVSYTMVAYMLLTLRAAGHALGLPILAELLRFPMLVMACATTTIWWLVLVPILLQFTPNGTEGRRKFMKFNFSFFLLNVHLLNMPLAILDHRFSWRPLVFCDLWLALGTALLYCLFYLNVLDRHGLHLYIILSPRPWWSILVYSSIIALYVGLFRAFG